MTALLDKAIAELRALPEEEQDWAAENINWIMRERERSAGIHLTPEQAEEVKRTLADLGAGRERFLTDEETEAMWKSLGV
jgi:hypothetical protein